MNEAFSQIPVAQQPPVGTHHQDYVPDMEGHELIKEEPNTLIWSATFSPEQVPAIYKMYRHRGAISWQREKLFQFRVEREFEACTYLHHNGIPTTLPLDWFTGYDATNGRYEVLCTREIPKAVPLSEVIISHPVDGLDLKAVLRTLRAMHSKGFFHGRLDLRNILTAESPDGAMQFYMMDTPQAILFHRDITNTRMAKCDLLHIAGAIYRHADAPLVIELLQEYGCSASQTQEILSRVARGPSSTKHSRNWYRFEFGVRKRCRC